MCIFERLKVKKEKKNRGQCNDDERLAMEMLSPEESRLQCAGFCSLFIQFYCHAKRRLLSNKIVQLFLYYLLILLQVPWLLAQTIIQDTQCVTKLNIAFNTSDRLLSLRIGNDVATYFFLVCLNANQMSHMDQSI